MEMKTGPIEKGSKHWIFSLLAIPRIGGLLATLITVAPAAVFSLMFIAIAPADDSIPGTPVIIITAILISCMLISTWWWLHYLERKIGLAIYLPIPFINIRLRWVLYPFMLPFLGIKRAYSALTNKGSTDS